MENVYSNSLPEPPPLSGTSEQMRDFNNLCQEGVPKMMPVTDDLHRMVDYIRDLRNMKTWEMYIQLALLTIIGILMLLILKYQNGKQKQKRRRRSNRDKYRSNDIRSENSNSEDPSMLKARVFVGNLKKTRVSREDLAELFKCCGDVLGATLFKGYALIQFSTQTEAELSVQILNGYTWEGSELVVKILTLYSKNDAIDRSNVSQNSNNNTVGDISNSRNVKLAKNMIRDITNARDVNLGTSKQTTFNQNTTNFIVCSLDSLKAFDV